MQLQCHSTLDYPVPYPTKVVIEVIVTLLRFYLKMVETQRISGICGIKNVGPVVANLLTTCECLQSGTVGYLETKSGRSLSRASTERI